jgi:hypothetical protein
MAFENALGWLNLALIVLGFMGSWIDIWPQARFRGQSTPELHEPAARWGEPNQGRSRRFLPSI